ALSVDHRSTQGSDGKTMVLPSSKEMIFGFTLVDSIEPVAVIRCALLRRLRDQVTFIVCFAKWMRQVFPHQVDLAGADKDVMAGPLLENLDDGERICPSVKRGVDHSIEG